MTREEAIKRIKDWNLDDGTMEVLSAAIPELRKSEDERIRKALIQYIKDKVSVILGWRKEELINWLEKQGEQKPVCQLNNLYGNVKFPFKARVKSSGAIVTIHGGQLSMDCKEWINYQSDAEDGYKGYKPDELELVCEVEQKYAWSEEDKENISMLIDLVESKEESMEVKIELSAWLKSLKERVQPQPKQEWSEEDEERYVSCLQRLGTGNLKQPETINTVWLKSLKERVQLV